MSDTNYNTILGNRRVFNELVYTPLSDALRILDERKKDSELIAKIETLLSDNIPEILKDKKCAVLGRHVATPNRETRRFISLAREHGLFPVFFEYHEDKFTSNNEYKHSLGQIHVEDKANKNGVSGVEKITIVDFNVHNGKKLSEVKTLWGQSLTDFHRGLFTANDYKPGDLGFYDASGWFRQQGGMKAIEFYSNLMLLFVCHGILFENFLISETAEGHFTRDIVLPTLEKVTSLTGLKPLIVPLEPIDLETDGFWMHHEPSIRKIIPEN